MTLLLVEMRRALRRRLVRVMVGLALLACVLAGLGVFLDSAGKTTAELLRPSDAHAAAMVHWWGSGAADDTLAATAFFLLMGGLLGGASVVGAEWRAGTVTTVLTWEPRRVRLHAARTGAVAILAFVISFLLQAVFLAALVPAVAANGTTAGVDGGWWIGLVAAMARISLLTALTATIGAGLATLGRNTVFALAAVFGWMVAVENLIRGLRPGLQRFLLGENLVVVLGWAQLDNVGFSRPPAVALVTLAVYGAAVAVVAGAVFRRRDIAGAS